MGVRVSLRVSRYEFPSAIYGCPSFLSRVSSVRVSLLGVRVSRTSIYGCPSFLPQYMGVRVSSIRVSSIYGCPIYECPSFPPSVRYMGVRVSSDIWVSEFPLMGVRVSFASFLRPIYGCPSFLLASFPSCFSSVASFQLRRNLL